MRTQTFAAFLLSAALPAIVAALPTNRASASGLTYAPSVQARNTHQIQNINSEIAASGPNPHAVLVTRQDGEEPTSANGLGFEEDGIEQDDYNYEPEENSMDEENNDATDFEEDEPEQADHNEEPDMESRQDLADEDSNWEGNFDADDASTQDFDLEEPEQHERDLIPSSFWRRHSPDDGHEHSDDTDITNAHSGQHDDEDETEDQALERRQLDDIVEEVENDDEAGFEEGDFEGDESDVTEGLEEDDEGPEDAVYDEEDVDEEDAEVEEDVGEFDGEEDPEEEDMEEDAVSGFGDEDDEETWDSLQRRDGHQDPTEGIAPDVAPIVQDGAGLQMRDVVFEEPPATATQSPPQMVSRRRVARSFRA